MIKRRHLRELERSGLSRETIQKAGIFSADGKQVKDALGFNRTGEGGLAFPYPSLSPESQGQADAAYMRVKPNRPKGTGKDWSRMAKYLSPKDSTNRLYAPGLEKTLADPDVPLVFTEGEKKTLKANQEGIPTVGLAGVWGEFAGRKETGSSPVIPDLDKVNLKDRQVRIAFDSDLAQKKHVERAEAALARELKARGARVEAVCLPDGPGGKKVGLDDYLLTHTKEDFEKLPKKAY